MPRPIIAVDKYGFPIPSTFHDVPRPGESLEAGLVGTGKGRRPLVVPRTIQAVILVTMAVIALGAIFGRQVGCWVWVGLAEQRLRSHRAELALQALEQAEWFQPETPQVFYLRGQAYLQQNRLEAALVEFDDFVRTAPPGNCQPFMCRMELLQQLAFRRPERAQQFHQEAIADAGRAIEIVRHSHHRGLLASLLNGRAYARALAGVQLKEGLQDIDEALQHLDSLRRPKQAGLPRRIFAAAVDHFRRGNFLDTRGLLRLKLGQAEAARDDFEMSLGLLGWAEGPLTQSHADAAYWRLSIRRARAVILHHRGEAFQTLGQPERAVEDQQQAMEMGYDPPNGVF